MTIEEVFSETGPFKKANPYYQPRSNQIRLSEAMQETIGSDYHLVSEAPVGTGKSLAYLTPAILALNGEQSRIIVVTSGITLQEQLINKDLPFLQSTLGKHFTFGLVKGMNNFLCRYEFEEAQRTKTLYSGNSRDQDEARAIESWAATTKTGDRTSLPIVPQPHMWERVSTSTDQCLGDVCPKRDVCHALKARKQAAESNIIVCNYHIFLADLKIRMESNGSAGILPTAKAIILDEAHKLPEISRDFFGFSLGMSAFSNVRRRLKRLGYDPNYDRENIHTLAEEFFEGLHKYMSSYSYKAYLRAPKPVSSTALIAGINNVTKFYARELNTTVSSLESMNASSLTEDQRALRKLTLRMVEISNQIQSAMNLSRENTVFSLEDSTPKPTKSKPRPTPMARIVARVIDVSTILGNQLFAKKTPIILTSATIRVNNSFEFYNKDVGLQKPRELAVGSPFNYQKQCFCIIPDGMPDPKDPGYQTAVNEKIVEFTKITNGRTLGLFTSYKSMQSAYETLIKATKHRVLKQGDMPNDQLITEFKRDVHSILLGTHSFWEGVDVPGEACSAVIIDKLPFKHMDDPLTAYHKDTSKKFFDNHYIPNSVIMFRQGIGRLIRTATDRGILVILDPRVITQRYGSTFLDSMPKMYWSPESQHAQQFMDGMDPEQIVG